LETPVVISLKDLYLKTFGFYPDKVEELPVSGSARKYYRLSHETKDIIGVSNKDQKENNTFVEFTRHFYKKGLHVPEILAFDNENFIYLEQDLGNVTLYDKIISLRDGKNFSPELTVIYKRVIDHLIRFQLLGGKGLNFELCYPRSKFDKQSMLWDLNYFKHYFIKLAGVVFDEQKLEDDFDTFTNYLSIVDSDYFLYRDFQSRNIMLFEGDLYFVDYQGGRQGALQYDLASLLYDAKADIPQNVREELLEYYIDKLSEQISIDKASFREQYYGFVLIRIMQAFGAYGYRGFFERKQHFLLSIPYALKNLDWVLQNIQLKVNIPTLKGIFEKLILSPNLKQLSYEPSMGLTILVNSFSYKKNIPLDNSGHGGGFVFDCRFLPNPGREVKYQLQTGKDPEVIEYLNQSDDVEIFIQRVIQIIDGAVDNYLKRNFTNLMVSFGCTGGRHRSVYCAGRMAEHLATRKEVNTVLRHIELEIIEKNQG
jgi:aminoglycoside/choline kinase family phosphotransferase